MKKVLGFVVTVFVFAMLVIQPALIAANEEKAPEPAKVVEIAPEAAPAANEAAVEEENEDVKNLKEAAAKLRKGEVDTVLADKLDALAEDLAW
ncbi:MAG: hypothetical protein HY582_05700 [Candidatus Omnitrophica bacterium]|nr:hypothetical protein [Candidatus Omnitrophota bacterium]